MEFSIVLLAVLNFVSASTKGVNTAVSALLPMLAIILFCHGKGLGKSQDLKKPQKSFEDFGKSY